MARPSNPSRHTFRIDSEMASQDFPHYADLKAKAVGDLVQAKTLGSPTTLTIPP